MQGSGDPAKRVQSGWVRVSRWGGPGGQVPSESRGPSRGVAGAAGAPGRVDQGGLWWSACGQPCCQPWSWGALWPDRGQSSRGEAGRGAGRERGAVGWLPRAGVQPDWRGREELGEMSVWGHLLGHGNGGVGARDCFCP